MTCALDVQVATRIALMFYLSHAVAAVTFAVTLDLENCEQMVRELAHCTGICATFCQAKNQAQHVKVGAGLHPCKKCSNKPPRNKDRAQKTRRPNPAQMCRHDRRCEVPRWVNINSLPSYPHLAQAYAEGTCRTM